MIKASFTSVLAVDGSMNRQCESTKRQKGTPIDLYTFITPVLVLLGSFIASFIILIAEVCLNYVKKQNQQNSIEVPTQEVVQKNMI